MKFKRLVIGDSESLCKLSRNLAWVRGFSGGFSASRSEDEDEAEGSIPLRFPFQKIFQEDKPDVLGLQCKKLLKEEIDEQARFDLMLAKGEEQLQEYHRAADRLWKRLKSQVRGKRAFQTVHDILKKEQEQGVDKEAMRGLVLKLLRNSKYFAAWKLSCALVRRKLYVLEPVDYRINLACAAAAGHRVYAQKLFGSLPSGIEPLDAYHALLAGYARSKDRLRAEQVVAELKEQGIYTEAFALNQMMFLHQRPDLSARIPQLFKEATVQCGVSPDISSYNMYIAPYSKEGKVRNVDELFNLLKADPNVKPNESTYIIVACGYVCAGEFETASKYLLELEEAIASGTYGRKQSTFNKLLRLYGDVKDKEGVENIWSILCSRPLKATDSYSYAIEAFGKVDEVYRAEQVFASSDGLTRTRQVVSMLQVYTDHGLMPKARQLFRSLPRKNMKDRAILYRHLIAGYLKENQERKAMACFRMGQTVLQSRCTIKVWYDALLDIMVHFADKGDLFGAEKCYAACSKPKRWKYVDVRVFRLLLKAYINAKAPLDRLLGRIANSKIHLDPETRQLIRELRKKA